MVSIPGSGHPDQRYTRTPSRVFPPEPPFEEDAGDATRRMQVLLAETIARHPPHYQSALALLRERFGQDASRWICRGAMETRLDEDFMEVTFDFRTLDAPHARRRLLIAVSMSYGKVRDLNLRELKPGEHSGIQAFEMVV